MLHDGSEAVVDAFRCDHVVVVQDKGYRFRLFAKGVQQPRQKARERGVGPER
jgi:hypothetical protein